MYSFLFIVFDTGLEEDLSNSSGVAAHSVESGWTDAGDSGPNGSTDRCDPYLLAGRMVPVS